MFHFPKFSAIRSSHRPKTLLHRVTAALPDLPHPRRVGAATIVSAVTGLVAVLIGIAAVIFRDKLISIVRRGDGGEEEAPDAAEVSRGDGGEEQAPDAAEVSRGREEQAPDAAGHKLASMVRAAEHRLASIVSHDGGEEQAPGAEGK
jgi:hypothetical protein